MSYKGCRRLSWKVSAAASETHSVKALHQDRQMRTSKSDLVKLGGILKRDFFVAWKDRLQ